MYLDRQSVGWYFATAYLAAIGRKAESDFGSCDGLFTRSSAANRVRKDTVAYLTGNDGTELIVSASAKSY